MLKKIRKSSASVTLVLIGTAMAGGGLAGCSKDEMRRDVYASKQDCLADWGNTPADCEPAYDRRTGNPYATHYYGRPYSVSGSTADGVAHSSRAISSTTVSRGGFGGSARSSSSSGG